MEENHTLHLPDLHISRFRGIDDVSISRLGRVTLIAGKNGIGKTTVLDAIRVYASRGSFVLMSEILRTREEVAVYIDENGEKVLTPDFESLPYGRVLSPESAIAIGPTSETKQLRIRLSYNSQQLNMSLDDSPTTDDILIERKLYDKTDCTLSSNITTQPRHRLRLQESQFYPPIRCESVGPGVIDNPTMAKFWDNIALTDYEDRAVQALQLIYGDKVERLAIIGSEMRGSLHFRYGLRAIVKMREQERPIPLRSLGDGAIRMFGVTLALANSQDGFLLIDEAENGIHHSVQRAYWRMVLQTAQEYNVQVFATTHSSDCIRGFAQAIVDTESIDGALIRLQRRSEHLRAVEYSPQGLQTAAKYGIEVR